MNKEIGETIREVVNMVVIGVVLVVAISACERIQTTKDKCKEIQKIK